VTAEAAFLRGGVKLLMFLRVMRKRERKGKRGFGGDGPFPANFSMMI
jgi:hypothetical protein